MVAAYRQPERDKGKQLMQDLITAICKDVPEVLKEIKTLGRTLKKRATDILPDYRPPQDQ